MARKVRPRRPFNELGKPAALKRLSIAKLRDDLMSSITQLRREVDVRLDELTRRQNQVGEQMDEVMSRIGAIVAPYITEMAAYENLVTRVTKLERADNAALRAMLERMDALEKELRQMRTMTFSPTPVRIKGGFINFYAVTRDGTVDLGSCQGPFPDRDTADAMAHEGRVACIKMPDFAQGHGIR